MARLRLLIFLNKLLIVCGVFFLFGNWHNRVPDLLYLLVCQRIVIDLLLWWRCSYHSICDCAIFTEHFCWNRFSAFLTDLGISNFYSVSAIDIDNFAQLATVIFKTERYKLYIKNIYLLLSSKIFISTNYFNSFAKKKTLWCYGIVLKLWKWIVSMLSYFAIGAYITVCFFNCLVGGLCNGQVFYCEIFWQNKYLVLLVLVHFFFQFKHASYVAVWILCWSHSLKKKKKEITIQISA